MNNQNSQTTLESKSPHQTILDRELKISAQCIGIAEETLQHWLDQYRWASSHTLFNFLHLIKKYHLDPLVDELSIIKNLDGSCQAYITFDGWSKIINQHPQYAGMSLRESSAKDNNMPIWMECTIYRNDRILPIVVTEYFTEVQTDHIAWKKMPKRMLRHRVIQQCARLALGISSPENITSNDQGKKVCATNEEDTQDAKIMGGLTQTERLKRTLINSK